MRKSQESIRKYKGGPPTHHPPPLIVLGKLTKNNDFLCFSGIFVGFSQARDGTDGAGPPGTNGRTKIALKHFTFPSFSLVFLVLLQFFLLFPSFVWQFFHIFCSFSYCFVVFFLMFGSFLQLLLQFFLIFPTILACFNPTAQASHSSSCFYLLFILKTFANPTADPNASDEPQTKAQTKANSWPTLIPCQYRQVCCSSSFAPTLIRGQCRQSCCSTSFRIVLAYTNPVSVQARLLFIIVRAYTNPRLVQAKLLFNMRHSARPPLNSGQWRLTFVYCVIGLR